MRKILLILTLFIGLGYSQNDCPASFQCAGFSDTPSGSGTGGQFGEINAGTDGCLSGEHNSMWITVTILTTGTFQFIINPNMNNNDFDFAVWGPNSGCPPTGAPIRCNFAANTGNTGLNTTATSTSEGAGGVKWCQQMNVIAGQTYIILIDNFTTNNGFNMTFGGTSTLDCTLLPIELFEFYGVSENTYNILNWSTLSEINNDYFIIEQSIDGLNWTEFGRIDGAGNSSEYLEYSFDDYSFVHIINYYRLSQVDFDGTIEIFNLISIDNRNIDKSVIKVTNLLGQEVDDSYTGIKVIHYSDGSTSKKIGK